MRLWGSMAICATGYCGLVTFYLPDIDQRVLARYGEVGALALRRVYWHVGERDVGGEASGRGAAIEVDEAHLGRGHSVGAIELFHVCLMFALG